MRNTASMSLDQAKSHKKHLQNQGLSHVLLVCVIFKVYFIALSYTRKAPFQNYTVFFTAEFSYVDRNCSAVPQSQHFCKPRVYAYLSDTACCFVFGWNSQECVLSSYSIVIYCFFVNYIVRGL